MGVDPCWGKFEGLAHWPMVKVLTVISVVYASHHNMPKYRPCYLRIIASSQVNLNLSSASTLHLQ